MATIKSGDSAVQLSVDATSKAARVSLYDPTTGAPMVSYIRGNGMDLDTTAGVDARDAIAIALPGAGGAQVGGTSTAPLRTDPTGTTTQPVSGAVTVSNFPATQPVSGSVAVGNFPATQAVSGTVTVANPQSAVSVSNFPSTQTVAGSVAVTNLPSTQMVQGAVNVNNFPASQTVAGTVTIGGFTSTTPINVNSLDPDIGFSYTIGIDVVPTTVTAGTVFLSIRNGGAKTMYIARFDLQQGFVGTAAASRSSFEFIRFSGTPTGGTASTPVKKISAAPASTATVLTAPAGLTVTGLTFDAAAFHRQTSANQLAATSTQDVTFADNDASKLQLAPGEGVAIRANGAVVAGAFLSGSIGWHER